MKKYIFFIAMLLSLLIHCRLMAQEPVFEPTNGYKGGQLFEVTVHNNTLYALSLDGVIRSEDDGESWQISLELPLDEAYYNNNLSSKLLANDSIIFVLYYERINDERMRFMKQSIDQGISWSEVEVSFDFHFNSLKINNNYLYSSDAAYYANLQDLILTFYETEKPSITGERYFYQGDYVFMYNSDSLYFSSDNINWVYKPKPTTNSSSFYSNPAVINQDLYIILGGDLYKTALTEDTTYITLDINHVSNLVSYDHYLYYEKSWELFEINTITEDTFHIEGVSLGVYRNIQFTNEYAYVGFQHFNLSTIDDVAYSPVLKFHRFSNIQEDDLSFIRSSLDRENSFKLVVINNKLFCCSVHGLYRYDEQGNEWHFVETPFWYVTDISWHDGYYYIVSDGVYQTANFETWQPIYLTGGGGQFMLPYKDRMLFFGFLSLTAYDDTFGAWTVNEIEAISDGTYPGMGVLFPPTIYNDTLVIHGNSGNGMAYSVDGGLTWGHFNNSFQSNYGFPIDNNVYYFERYLSSSEDIAEIYFVKKNNHESITFSDYTSIYNGAYHRSEPNLYFYFLKSEELLFFSIPNVGILYSNDDGEIWQMLDNSIPALQVNSLAATEDYIYFASKQHGVRRLKKDVITEVDDINVDISLKVFPNPVDEMLQFSKPQTGVVYDLAGKSILTFKNQEQINTSELIIGFYVIKFDDEYQSVRTFVKQ